jgi:acetylornithine aminotransferase/acetylornithine/N-succinyldiaminopimelate aminotransferase
VIAAAAGLAPDTVPEPELAVYARLDLDLVRGEGCWVEDASGERYLDLYGGHAVALTGHCHPRVVAAVREQAARLVFYSSAVRSSLRDRAGQLLLRRAPFPNSRIFHCCSGSEANEVAFKIARQATGRRRVVSFTGSFHGRTLAALSACGIDRYRATAGPVVAPEHVRVPFGDCGALERAVDADTAAIVVEPIQSLGGAVTADDAFYRDGAAIARDAGACLVFDEVQTGLGRTGSFFFGDRLGLRPDLITLAKGLASGIPAAAVIVAPHLAATVRSGDHGSTFGGGPVAMAAMAATLEVIEEEDLVGNAARIGERLAAGLRLIPGVQAVRGRGLLVGVVLDRPAAAVQRALLVQRIITGTSADPAVLRLLPPLTIGPEEVDRFLAALRTVLAESA